MELHPRFITLEGIDGAGKSSHVSRVEDWVRQRGHPVTVTREPGGTALGERLRGLLLHEPMAARTEALLMFAAREEHLERVIRPALARGEWVISDRFSDASFAYQGGGRGVPGELLEILEHWVHAGLQPDLTLWFDLDTATAQARVAADQRIPDRFEQEQLHFFERVRAAYQARAGRFPDRIRRIDAGGDRDGVWQAVERVLETL